MALPREPGAHRGTNRRRPVAVAASAVTNPRGGAPDLLRSSVTYSDSEAHLEVGFCEAVERRESLIAGADRKAFVNELDESIPLRLIRWGRACAASTALHRRPTATPDELARRQCLAFLEATRDHALAMKEGLLWGAPSRRSMISKRHCPRVGPPSNLECPSSSRAFISSRTFRARLTPRLSRLEKH